MKITTFKVFISLLVLIVNLFPLCSFSANKNFIVRVTELNDPQDQISFSGNIMQMSENGFVPVPIHEATPFIQEFKTSFVSIKLHATSFLPHKIKVEIIEHTKKQDNLLVVGEGYRVFVQAGANGFIFVSSH